MKEAQTMMKRHTSCHGFTLTELLVGIAISSIVATGIYSTLYSQQKSYVTQEQIVAMHQNLRAAMALMAREIRMAGCDPTGGAGAGIQSALTNSMRFTADLTNNAGTGNPDGDTGDINEDITYALFDADGDGDNDLGRNDVNGSGNQIMAENIDWINFVYLDKNGAPTTTIADIRSVQVCILARADRPDPGYKDTATYSNQQGTASYVAPGDNYRRKLLTAEVKCRNLGLI